LIVGSSIECPSQQVAKIVILIWFLQQDDLLLWILNRIILSGVLIEFHFEFVWISILAQSSQQ
jgi:hypothetical protein